MYILLLTCVLHPAQQCVVVGPRRTWNSAFCVGTFHVLMRHGCMQDVDRELQYHKSEFLTARVCLGYVPLKSRRNAVFSVSYVEARRIYQAFDTTVAGLLVPIDQEATRPPTGSLHHSSSWTGFRECFRIREVLEVPVWRGLLRTRRRWTQRSRFTSPHWPS